MKIFGYIVVKEVTLLDFQMQVEQSRDRIALLQNLNQEQGEQLKKLRGKVDQERLKEIIDIDIADPIPEKADARKAYVERTAGFYVDILKPKCVQMISVFHKLLEEETNDEKTDTILKIGIYVCREWMKWGGEMVNEALSYRTEKPLTPTEQKEELITQVKL